MRALPPLVARAGLGAVILLGSFMAAAGVLFATGPATGAAPRAVPEHMSASATPLCPPDAGHRPAPNQGTGSGLSP